MNRSHNNHSNKASHQKVLTIFMLLTSIKVFAVNVNLANIQAKNESQINSINTNYQATQVNNKSLFGQSNVESVQQSNQIKISNLKFAPGNMPNIDLATIIPNKLQLDQLINQSQKSMSEMPENSNIYLFLSFTSLDKDTVLMYAKQASKYNIPIILRGFINNSFKETGTYIKAIREQYPELTILIDPPAYEKYDINVIPALVVAKSAANPIKDGCNAPGDYVKVYGEISITGMLDYVRFNSKNPALVLAANNSINGIRAKRYFKSE